MSLMWMWDGGHFPVVCYVWTHEGKPSWVSILNAHAAHAVCFHIAVCDGTLSDLHTLLRGWASLGDISQATFVSLGWTPLRQTRECSWINVSIMPATVLLLTVVLHRTTNSKLAVRYEIEKVKGSPGVCSLVTVVAKNSFLTDVIRFFFGRFLQSIPCALVAGLECGLHWKAQYKGKPIQWSTIKTHIRWSLVNRPSLLRDFYLRSHKLTSWDLTG